MRQPSIHFGQLLYVTVIFIYNYESMEWTNLRRWFSTFSRDLESFVSRGAKTPSISEICFRLAASSSRRSYFREIEMSRDSRCGPISLAGHPTQAYFEWQVWFWARRSPPEFFFHLKRHRLKKSFWVHLGKFSVRKRTPKVHLRGSASNLQPKEILKYLIQVLASQNLNTSYLRISKP